MLSTVIGDENVNVFEETVKKSRNYKSEVEIFLTIPDSCEATIFQVLASEEAVVCVFRSSKGSWLSLIDQISPISVGVSELTEDGHDFRFHYTSEAFMKDLQHIAPQTPKEMWYSGPVSQLGLYSQTDHDW